MTRSARRDDVARSIAQLVAKTVQTRPVGGQGAGTVGAGLREQAGECLERKAPMAPAPSGLVLRMREAALHLGRAAQRGGPLTGRANCAVRDAPGSAGYASRRPIQPFVENFAANPARARATLTVRRERRPSSSGDTSGRRAAVLCWAGGRGRRLHTFAPCRAHYRERR